MGYALAQAAIEAGANVTLISGPVALTHPDRVTCIAVESAIEMHTAVMQQVANHQIFIGCAAVADYRPDQAQRQKIKKSSATLQLNLIKNPDILADVAELASPPFCVGFAAESENLEKYALQKFEQKKLHMIAANNITNPGIGFNSDYNALHVFWRGGNKQLPTASKTQIARQLIALIAQQYSLNTETKK